MATNEPTDNSEKRTMDVDKNLENGPIQKRCCTDIICWAIWITACAFWVFSVSYGISKGNPRSVFAPWDEDNRQCGVTPAVLDHQYAYFYTLLSAVGTANVEAIKYVVCTDSCPKYNTIVPLNSLDTLDTLGI